MHDYKSIGKYDAYRRIMPNCEAAKSVLLYERKLAYGEAAVVPYYYPDASYKDRTVHLLQGVGSLNGNVMFITDIFAAGTDISDAVVAMPDGGDPMPIKDIVGDLYSKTEFKLEKIDNYTYKAKYERDIDYDFAIKECKKRYFELGACSAVRKGNMYGRCYDYYYDDTITYMVHTDRQGKRVNATDEFDNYRYKVDAMAGGISDLNVNTVFDTDSVMYKMLPFIIVDGINEKGLVCNANVVPLDKGYTVGTVPTVEKREEICGIMLVRYILDNFATAKEAVEYIQKYVSVYMPHSDRFDQEMHYMLADKEHTYVLEFIDNETRYIEVGTNDSLPACMTNFHLDGVNLVNGRASYTDSNIEDYGEGLERYNLILDNISNWHTESDMLRFLTSTLKYTNAYTLTAEDKVWKTEFSGETQTFGKLTIKDPLSKYGKLLSYVRTLYKNRSRTKGRDTWHSVHTCVYDLDKKTMTLVTQERGTESAVTYNYYPEERFQAIEESIRVIDQSIGLINQEINVIKQDIVGIDASINRIDDTIRIIDGSVNYHKHWLDELDTRTMKLDTSVNYILDTYVPDVTESGEYVRSAGQWVKHTYPSPVEDKYMRYVQLEPSDTWVITHNFGKCPSVTVNIPDPDMSDSDFDKLVATIVNENGDDFTPEAIDDDLVYEYCSDVDYNDDNTLTIKFPKPTVGVAHLN